MVHFSSLSPNKRAIGAFLGGTPPRKCLRKIVIIFILMGSAAGCASGPRASQRGELLGQLQEENTRLEQEVTRLREEKLRKSRVSGPCKVEKDESSPEQERSEPSAPSLPTLVLAPEGEKGTEALPIPVATLVQAHSLSENSSQDDLRPVLKVRGEHEAWVYHRPLKASEREAQPSTKSTLSSSSPKSSSSVSKN